MLVNYYIEKTLACTKTVRGFDEVLELSLSCFLFTVFLVFCCPNDESSELPTQIMQSGHSCFAFPAANFTV